MGENIQVIPMATIMLLGPQILSAMFILTGKNHIKASLAYILSIFLAASLGTLAMMLLIDIFNLSAPSDSEPSTLVNIIKYAIVALLFFGIYKNYRDRNKKITPKWMKVIMAGNPRDNFKLGFVLVASLPLLISLVFHRKSEIFLPKANKWLLKNSWMVQVLVLGLFIYLILK